MPHPDDQWILLRLRGMAPGDFEVLCFELLRATGHADSRHLGGGGCDGGVDVQSIGADGRRWVTQCKRQEKFGPVAAREELRKAINEPLDPPPQIYRLARPYKVTRDLEEALREEARTAPFALEVASSWAETELLGLIRDYPEIRARWIGSRREPARKPFWNVPRRNEFFTGRATLLEKLEKRLAAAGSAALTQELTGLGGVGKSQTAIDYCHRYRADYPGCPWAVQYAPGRRRLCRRGG